MKKNNKYREQINELVKKIMNNQVMCICCGKSVLNHNKEK